MCDPSVLLAIVSCFFLCEETSQHLLPTYYVSALVRCLDNFRELEYFLTNVHFLCLVVQKNILFNHGFYVCGRLQ